MRLGAILSALLVAAVVGAASPVASAARAETDQTLSATYFPSGHNLELFWRGANGGLERDVHLDYWLGASELPGSAGSLDSAPTATTWGEQLNTYWRTPDNGLDEQWFDPSTQSWEGPIELPGTSGTLTSAPDTVPWGASEEVYWRASDGGLEEMYFDTAWHGPFEIGGTSGHLAGAPSASTTSSVVNVFWADGSGTLEQSWFYNGAWYGPAAIPSTAGSLTSAPSAITNAGGGTDVFWRGADGGLDEAWYDGQWHLGEIPGTAGQLASAPAAVQTPSQVEVFWTTASGGIEEMAYDTAWHGPSPLVDGPPAPPAPAPTTTITPPPVSTARHLTVWMAFHTKPTAGGRRIDRIRFRGLPAHAVVHFTCLGRRCPRIPARWIAGGHRRLSSLLARGRFRSGQRLIIVVTAPGCAPEIGELIFRARRKPAGRLLTH